LSRRKVKTRSAVLVKLVRAQNGSLFERVKGNSYSEIELRDGNYLVLSFDRRITVPLRRSQRTIAEKPSLAGRRSFRLHLRSSQHWILRRQHARNLPSKLWHRCLSHHPLLDTPVPYRTTANCMVPEGTTGLSVPAEFICNHR